MSATSTASALGGARPIRIDGASFVIATSGFADGPAQPLRDYLVSKGARRVTLVSHPLVAEGERVHRVSDHVGDRVRVTDYRLPHRPPYTYALDPFVPPRLPHADVWFAFNNLAAARGLIRRRRGAAGRVVYWAVDFVPDRFGRSPLTRAYELLDRFACVHADARVELSHAALDARTEHLGLAGQEQAPTAVVPMGAWLSRTETVTDSCWRASTIVFLGHLVERQGVSPLLDACALLLARHPELRIEVIGDGPLAPNLRRRADELGLADRTRFHGFIADHREVERLLARATVAAAPYLEQTSNFTRYADPGKLKAYLAAGLPIIVTDVPPNALELASAGAALIAAGNAGSLAAALSRPLGDERLWRDMSRAALACAQRFDWNTVFEIGLARLGLG